VPVGANAYNSLWQVRNDAWSSLEESTAQLDLGRGQAALEGFELVQKQIETSRNTVLFMTTISTTRSSVAFLIEVLVTIARELDDQITGMSPVERDPRARGPPADRSLRAAAGLQRLPSQLHRRPRVAHSRG